MQQQKTLEIFVCEGTERAFWCKHVFIVLYKQEERKDNKKKKKSTPGR